MNLPYVSVVIATYNRQAALPKVIKDLLTQELGRPFDYEIIVVDNNSTDQKQAIASVRVYPGADASFTLFSDDGSTYYAYEKGVSSITRLDWDEATHQFKHEGAAAWSGPDKAVVEIIGH